MFAATLNLFIYISEAELGSSSPNHHQHVRIRRDTLKNLMDCVRKNRCSACNSHSVPQKVNSAASVKYPVSIIIHSFYQQCIFSQQTQFVAGFNVSFHFPLTVSKHQRVNNALCSWETRSDRCFCIQERRSYLLGSKDDMATQDKHINPSTSPTTLHQQFFVSEELKLESGTWEFDWVDALAHSGEDGQVSLGPKMKFGHPPLDSSFLHNDEHVS